MAGMTVADMMADILTVAGVQRIYGLVGDSLNGLTDSLRRKNNLGFVAMEMKASGFLDTFTDMVDTDFAAIAMAAGIAGIRVEDPGLVGPALQEAFSRPGPVVVDVKTNRLELAMPPTITTKEAKGFSLYLLQAIIDGRGAEVVDLARTNLWR